MCKCVFWVRVCVQADKRSVEADRAVADVEKTHRRAKELDSEIKSMLKKIQGEGKLKFSGSTTPLVIHPVVSKCFTS